MEKEKERFILLCPKKWDMEYFLTRVTVLLHSHCSECQSNKNITSPVFRKKINSKQNSSLLGNLHILELMKNLM